MKYLNRKTLLGLALLAGLGTAGAETTASCVQPASPVIPPTTAWNFTNGGTGLGDSFAAENEGGSGVYGYGQSIVSFTDDSARRVQRYADTPQAYNIGDIKFLRIGFVWAENGGLSHAAPLNIYFGGIKIASFLSTEGNGGNGTMTGQNGTTFYSSTGAALGSTVSIPASGYLDSANSRISAQRDDGVRIWYYLRLPDSFPITSGTFRIEDPGVAGASGLYDDVRIYLPSTAQSYLCLRKQQNSGTAGQNFTFTAPGTDFSRAGGTATTSGTTTTSTIALTPLALKQSYTKTTVPGRITNPDSVTLSEAATGYLISRVDCDKPNDMSGYASQLSVNGTTPVTLTSLPFGVMTTCTVYNDSTADLVNKAPIVSLVKQFSRKSANDQVALTFSSPNLPAKTLTTTGTAAAYNVGQLQDTNYTYQTYNSGTVGTRIVYPQYTMNEVAAGGTTPLNSTNYVVTYQCVNSTQSNSTLSSGTLSGSYSFAFQPSLDSTSSSGVNLGDTVTCTISNTAVKTGSLTIQKSGPVISVPSGSSDVFVTYTITLTNPSSGGIPALNSLRNLVVTDTFTNGYYDSSSYSGTGTATTTAPSPVGPGGTVTWALPNWGNSEQGSRTITVRLKMPTLDAAKALIAGTRNVTDTATYSASRVNGVGVATTENGIPASVTTNLILVDQPVKTIRNITKGETTGTATTAANPGDTVEYCITVNNYSDLPANNYTLRDPLDSHLGPVAGSTYTLNYGVGGSTSSTSTQTSPFSQTIGNIPAATSSGPGTGQLCFQAKVQ